MFLEVTSGAGPEQPYFKPFHDGDEILPVTPAWVDLDVLNAAMRSITVLRSAQVGQIRLNLDRVGHSWTLAKVRKFYFLRDV